VLSRPVQRALLALCLLLPTFPLPGQAWEGWPAFQEAARRITAVEAQFVQKKTLPILARPLISWGRFYYQPPRSLRWEYERPVPSILVMQGGTVKRYLKDKGVWRQESGASLPAMQTVLEEIGQWQQGRFADNPHFRAELVEGPEPQVVLLPRQEAWRKVIQRIVLTPDLKRPGVIRSVQMTEDERTFTVIEFTQVKVNGPLAADLFEKAP
jgi:outer membrane lipoprotein-sorting protein